MVVALGSASESGDRSREAMESRSKREAMSTMSGLKFG